MAIGWVVIGTKRIENPSGCYNSPIWPMGVDNQTDTGAAIYDQENCKGPITGTVQPRARGMFEFGLSVSFPCETVD